MATGPKVVVITVTDTYLEDHHLTLLAQMITAAIAVSCVGRGYSLDVLADNPLKYGWYL